MGIKLLADITSLLKPARDVFFKKQCKLGELIVDLSLKQEIRYSNKLTEFPIESGANITDHVITRPTKLILQGRIVENTFDIVGNVQQITNLFTGNIVNNISNFARGVSVKQTTAYQILQTLWQNKSLVTVTFKLDTFEDMVIEDLSFTSDSSTLDNLAFDITLVQVKQAMVESSIISRSTSAAAGLKDLASSKDIFGKQDTKEASSAQGSYLRKKIDWAKQKIKNWF